MTKQERAAQAELADQLAEELEQEEPEDQEVEQAEENINDDAAEQEGETPDDDPVDYDECDEITAILNGIDFDITRCTTQESITAKILYLCNEERKVLDEFKDEVQILESTVYDKLYQTIVTVFDNYLNVLKNKLELEVKSSKLKCAMNRLKFIVGDLRRDKIDNKYQIKLLRYKNWLYGWKKWREHNILRKQEKERYKAEIKALKASPKTPDANKETPKSEPP